MVTDGLLCHWQCTMYPKGLFNSDVTLNCLYAKFCCLTLKALGFFSTSRPKGGCFRDEYNKPHYSRKRKSRKMKLCILIVERLSFRIKLKNLWWRHYLSGDVIIKLMLSSKFKNSYKSTRELIFKAKMGIETSIDVLKHFFSPLSQYFVVISIFLHKKQFCWRQQILKLQFLAVGMSYERKI